MVNIDVIPHAMFEFTYHWKILLHIEADKIRHYAEGIFDCL